MTRTNAILSRGMRTIAAILILALGAAALSLTLTKPASAQSVATPQQVGNLAAPTLSADVDERGVVLTWTFDVQVPSGWYLDEFAFLRKVGSDQSKFLRPSASATDRTYVDGLDSDSKTKWLNGTGISYKIRAVYRRTSDDRLRVGRESSFASVAGATSLTQVRQGYSPQNVSALAHADGVNLTWTFNESTMSPHGWKLVGFRVVRWLPGDVTGLVWVQSSDEWDGPGQRSFKDPLDHVTEAQRLPGFEWKYAVIAYYDQLASGSYSPRTQGKASILTFTAPTMPKPLNFKINYKPGTPLHEYYPRSLLLSWERPHLSWNASTGFTGIDQFHFYIGANGYEDGNHWISRSGQHTSHTWDTQWHCQGPFQILAQYGLFYSEVVTASEARHDC